MTQSYVYAADVPGVESHTVEVGGVRTHYLEAGSGPSVVLIHGGEFGACAELSWAEAMPALASEYRVVAPDLLGFGGSAKVFDFELGYRGWLRHLSATVEQLDLGPAHYVGTSMGGSLVNRLLSEDWHSIDMRSGSLLASGGYMPDNAAMQTLLAYDGSEDGMRRLIEVLFYDPVWSRDPDHVRRRWELSMLPGAWEASVASRVTNPHMPPRDDFGIPGLPDQTPYESMRVPVLVVAGTDDPLKEPGYADEIAGRMPQGRAVVLPECGHSPNIERREIVTDLLLEFFAEFEG